MKLALAALLLALPAAALAQAPAAAPQASFAPQAPAAPFHPPTLSGAFTDPANLRGERPTPRTGRELPIDGGYDVGGGKPDNALGLAQLLRKLSTRASILNIVAHPDDEDGGMLTLFARGLGARVADLSLTRGEGGQNAATGDFEDALGLLRTQELLANDRYTGVTQFFGTEVDFGFSKTKAESFAKWNHQRVLYDVVRAIRIYRPLVITSTWIGNATDGHGQHQVSGEIAQEAFVAAGDPTVFPSLTAEGILPWQPLKMYARVPMRALSPKGLYDYATTQYIAPHFTNYITGAVTTTIPSTDAVIHEGDPDPLLTVAAADRADLPPALAHAAWSTELSYIQFARIGLGLQKSQIGPGVRNAPSGAFDSPYHLYGSRLCSAPASARPSSATPERDQHTVANTVILSEGSQASSRAGVEGPLGCQPTHDSSPISNHPLPTPDSVATTQSSFFTGINTSIDGIATLAPSARGNIALVIKTNLAGIEHSIEEAQLDFKPGNPQSAATRLAEALTLTNMAIANVIAFSPDQLPTDQRANILHELRIKRVQLNDALSLALGINLQAVVEPSRQTTTAPTFPASEPTDPNVTPGSIVQVVSSLDASSPAVKLSDESIAAPSINPQALTGHGTDTPDSPHTLHILQNTVDLSPNAPFTRPYFTRSSIEQPYYDLLDPRLRSAPQTPPPVVAHEGLEYDGVGIEVAAVVTAATRLPNGQLFRQPISIIPRISVALQPHAQVVPFSERTFPVFMTVSPPGAVAATSLDGPRAWRTGPISTVGDTDKFTLTLPLGERQPFTLTGSALTQTGQKFTEGFRPVGYGDLPRTNFYTPATDRIVPVDLNLPAPGHRRIAYLPGTGDAVPEALASIGLQPTILTVADLTPAKLKAFDTVILGVRTYNAHPDLHGAPTQALLEFAKNGGNVVVQYQTDEFTAADAPFPLSLGANEKVVDETAPVVLLQPADPLLSVPNQITPADFNGWIEERGHGFLSTWDPRYTALTETHDPGAPSEAIAPQLPQRGGLLTVQLGNNHRGRWTYCAFALYRQLPEAVPGAFRLFINLLNP